MWRGCVRVRERYIKVEGKCGFMSNILVVASILAISVSVAYKFARIRHEQWLKERRAKERLQAHVDRYRNEYGEHQKGL